MSRRAPATTVIARMNTPSRVSLAPVRQITEQNPRNRKKDQENRLYLSQILGLIIHGLPGIVL